MCVGGGVVCPQLLHESGTVGIRTCDLLIACPKGSWICIAPHCEKLASEALRNGSHSFYGATTPHLPTPSIHVAHVKVVNMISLHLLPCFPRLGFIFVR